MSWPPITMLLRTRGSISASTMSVRKFSVTMDAVSRKMIAPASCWSFDRASASIKSDPASVSVRISATMGNSLKMRFRSKPSELMIGPSACRAG